MCSFVFSSKILWWVKTIIAYTNQPLFHIRKSIKKTSAISLSQLVQKYCAWTTNKHLTNVYCANVRLYNFAFHHVRRCRAAVDTQCRKTIETHTAIITTKKKCSAGLMTSQRRRDDPPAFTHLACDHQHIWRLIQRKIITIKCARYIHICLCIYKYPVRNFAMSDKKKKTFR